MEGQMVFHRSIIILRNHFFRAYITRETHRGAPRGEHDDSNCDDPSSIREPLHACSSDAPAFPKYSPIPFQAKSLIFWSSEDVRILANDLFTIQSEVGCIFLDKSLSINWRNESANISFLNSSQGRTYE